MNGRHSSNRAPADQPSDNGSATEPTDTGSVSDSTDNNPPFDSPTVSEAHCREWRRWLVEAIASGTASVVPLASLVDTIAERERDEISRSTIQTALTDQILPTVEREPGVEYDADRQLLVNYGH